MKEQLLKQIEELKRQVELLDKPKFEVGKWYKRQNGDIVFCEEVTKTGYTGFGLCSGSWLYRYIAETDVFTSVLTTDKEVEEALIKEAKKRGFKEGVRVKCAKDNTEWNMIHNIKEEHCYIKNNTITDGSGAYMFYKGKWAEIVKDEPIKIGGYEVKKEREDTYSIGCKLITGIEIRQIKSFMSQNKFKKVSFDGIETDLETINKILNL